MINQSHFMELVFYKATFYAIGNKAAKFSSREKEILYSNVLGNDDGGMENRRPLN